MKLFRTVLVPTTLALAATSMASASSSGMDEINDLLKNNLADGLSAVQDMMGEFTDRFLGSSTASGMDISNLEAVIESVISLAETFGFPLTNLLAPSASRVEVGKTFLESVVPVLRSSYSPEEAERMEKGFRKSQEIEEENLETYNKMNALKEEIDAESNPEKVEVLKEQMRELVQHMNDLVVKRLTTVGEMYQLTDNQMESLLRSPLMKLIKTVMDTTVLKPFLAYL